MVEIFASQTVELPPELCITQFPRILTGHFLYIEGLYPSLKVEYQEYLDTPELAFLVYSVDVTDLLFIGKYFVDRIGDVDRFVKAPEFIPQSRFYPYQELFSALFQN